MQSVLILLFFLLAGYLSQRGLSEDSREHWADRLNHFVIYLSLPALVFVYMVDLEIDSRFILPIASAWGLFALSALLLLLLSRYFQWSRSLTGALLMTVPFGNTSFLGIPLIKAFFGEIGIPYAIVYDQLGSFLILSTAGIVILSFYSTQQATLSKILHRIFTFPAFVTLILALLIDSQTPPAWLMTLLHYLASTLTPAALIAIGLHLKLRLEPDKIIPLGAGLFIKLILAPLVVLGIFLSLDLHSLSAQVSTLEAGMGPMISSAMLAMMAGLERRFIASLLGYGIVISFVTLALWYQVIR
jgi:predicted permease